MNQAPDKSVTVQIRMTDDCTGCAACANVCPVGAIKMEPYGQEGFYKPHVDPQVCINCGLCTKTCPQHEFQDKNQREPACYAAMAPDDIRLKSSSGGVFTILAEEILRQGGMVCGAAFDENWRVHHILVEDETGLEKLRGAKYVQSFISEDIFKQIKSHLEAERSVLFSGVACQVAGLYNFLRKDYENLYTVDLVCAYAPSPKVWDQYLNENYTPSDIRHISFRDKTTRGWGCWHNTITTISGVVEENKYMTPFLNRLFKGEHCVNCKFKRFPRPADFTMGDFWKIGVHDIKCDDRKGTSGFLLNSRKAEEYTKKIKDKFTLFKKFPLTTMSWQMTMYEPRTKSAQNFFKQIDSLPYHVNSTETPIKTKVGITNWWFVNNRGAILTNYALNEMVNNLGYEANTINYISPIDRKNYPGGFAEAFAKKYLRLTRPLQNKGDLKSINKDIGTFIAGSDQIFRYDLCALNNHLFYMGWVDAAHRKLLSYSASFAIDKFEANEFQKNLTRHFLSRFDQLSVREFDGVDIMRDTFGLAATQVLDPVFCIEPEKYENMAENATEKPEGDFIAYYIMWPTENNKKIIQYVQERLGGRSAIHLNSSPSIEHWLWCIKNAKFIVTDSFHAPAFSVIFNKQFAVIPAPREYPSRFKTLEKLTGLSTRFFYRNNDIYDAKDLFEPIDFTDCNQRMEKEIRRSTQWLKDALTAPKEYKLNPEQEMYDALISYQNEETLQLGIRCFHLEESIKELRNIIKNM